MVNWHRDKLVHEHTPGMGCFHHGKEETHQKLVPGKFIIKIISMISGEPSSTKFEHFRGLGNLERISEFSLISAPLQDLTF